MFKLEDDVEKYIKMMLVNFDVDQYVYKLLLAYDKLNDEVKILKVLIYEDYVHDDNLLNVDVDFLY